MSRPYPALLLGLAIGATATWHLTRPSASVSAPIINHPSSIINTWSWRDSPTPPTLAASSAAGAIAAWQTLRAPDGRPADFATRASSLRTLLVRLPVDAFPRLLGPFTDPKIPEDDRTLLQIAFSAWIEADPAAASAWAVGFPNLQNLAEQAVTAWAGRDARAAARWSCAVADPGLAARLAAFALPTLAALDSDHAFTLASSRGDKFLEKVLPGLIDAVAKTDPATALRTYGPKVWKNGDGFWRLREALSAWTARDPAAAIQWIMAQPMPKNRDITQLLGELARTGTERTAFATALTTLPGIANRQSVLGRLLASWASENPTEAVAWLDTLTDRNLRTVLLERAASMTYSDRSEQSLTFALAMPESANRAQRLGHLLSQWADKDSSAALAWLRAHADEPGVAAAGVSVQSTLLASIARDEPATAVAEWDALPPGPLKSSSIHAITQAWGQTDPAAALQWGAAQAKTLGVITYPSQDLVYNWSRKDGPAALAWVESLSEPNIRRYALTGLAGTWQDKAPRAATADLYSKIKDTTLRTETLTAHVQEWLTKDPAAARAWLEKSSALTPAQAATLLAP